MMGNACCQTIAPVAHSAAMHPTALRQTGSWWRSFLYQEIQNQIAQMGSANDARMTTTPMMSNAIQPDSLVKQIPRKVRSGFRLGAPASLTPAKRLKLSPA